MTRRFSLELLPDDASGGCLRVDLHQSTLSVAARFRLDPSDPGAESMLESLNGQPLEFTYLVSDFEEQRYLTGMQRSVQALYQAVLKKNRKGRFCFVSSCADLPAVPAAQFAARFLEAFVFECMSLSHALQRARVDMLRETGHPVGLLYCGVGRAACLRLDGADAFELTAV